MDAALNGPSGRTTLGPAVLTIGRAPSNALVVNDTKASSHHAEISPAGSGYNITDMGSTNGTFVNEQRLDRNVPRMLNTGDRVRVGDTVFTYEGPGAFSPDATLYAGEGNSPGYQPTVAAPPPYTNYDQPPPQGQEAWGASNPAWGASYPPPAAYPAYTPPVQPGYGAPGFAGMPATTTAPRTNRNLLIGLGAGGVVVVLLIVLFAIVLPSTPTKTLNSYCNAFKSGDYHTAYGLLSSSVQGQVTESQFTTIERQSVAPLGNVSSCVVSNVNQNGSAATGTITYTFGDGKSGPVNYTLVNENGGWKISKEG